MVPAWAGNPGDSETPPLSPGVSFWRGADQFKHKDVVRPGWTRRGGGCACHVRQAHIAKWWTLARLLDISINQSSSPLPLFRHVCGSIPPPEVAEVVNMGKVRFSPPKKLLRDRVGGRGGGECKHLIFVFFF